MNVLSVFVISPALIAWSRGKRGGWLIFGALLMLASLFSGEILNALILWLACMAIALLKKT
ncbi:MAG: hypothetical protein KBD60_01165 [Sterolibacterium sp.]|jgi:hypothetical protein|nr:hypothetical protein [Sterolibacterium sp.]